MENVKLPGAANFSSFQTSCQNPAPEESGILRGSYWILPEEGSSVYYAFLSPFLYFLCKLLLKKKWLIHVSMALLYHFCFGKIRKVRVYSSRWRRK